MHEDGTVNFEVLESIIEEQILGDTDAIISVGTTGEAATLTEEEHIEVIAHTVKVVNHRIPVIAGTGSNCTDSAIYLSKKAEEVGADGLLLVTPYYNKATQNGLYQHFKAIADASDLPIIIYNIPGRVVVELTPETMLRLADHPNIIGVKECTSLANMAYLIEHKPEEFLIYTGEDGDAFHAMNLGADGVISVASHTNGDEMHEMLLPLPRAI